MKKKSKKIWQFKKNYYLCRANTEKGVLNIKLIERRVAGVVTGAVC